MVGVPQKGFSTPYLCAQPQAPCTNHKPQLNPKQWQRRESGTDVATAMANQFLSSVASLRQKSFNANTKTRTIHPRRPLWRSCSRNTEVRCDARNVCRPVLRRRRLSRGLPSTRNNKASPRTPPRRRRGRTRAATGDVGSSRPATPRARSTRACSAASPGFATIPRRRCRRACTESSRLRSAAWNGEACSCTTRCSRGRRA